MFSTFYTLVDVNAADSFKVKATEREPSFPLNFTPKAYSASATSQISKYFSREGSGDTVAQNMPSKLARLIPRFL